MSTSPMEAAAPAPAENPAITLARAILAAENGRLTQEQTQFCRDQIYFLFQADDRVSSETLKAIVGAIEKRMWDRTMAEAAARDQALRDKALQHTLQRPLRWAALPPLERAAHLVAESVGGLESQLGRALITFARLAADDEGTAKKEPPDTFEPPKW